jgi:hypothetical protein
MTYGAKQTYRRHPMLRNAHLVDGPADRGALWRGERAGGGAIRNRYDDVRQVATGTLNAVHKTWLRISMNAVTDTVSARAFLDDYVVLP